MDEKFIEQAVELTDSLTTGAIEQTRAQRQVKPEGYEGICPDCEIEEVPPERVALGYYNCVTCQSRKEGRIRFFAR